VKVHETLPSGSKFADLGQEELSLGAYGEVLANLFSILGPDREAKYVSRADHVLRRNGHIRGGGASGKPLGSRRSRLNRQRGGLEGVRRRSTRVCAYRGHWYRRHVQWEKTGPEARQRIVGIVMCEFREWR